MSKDRRTVLRFALVGFAVAVAIVLYSVLTDSSPSPHPNLPLEVAMALFCPPSLLGAVCIDCEIGTGAFYVIWFFIGLINAVLYGVVGSVICYRRSRTKLGGRAIT
jgi:hypothetical protein